MQNSKISSKWFDVCLRDRTFHSLKPKEETLYELQNAMAKFIFQKIIINKLYVFTFTWSVRIYYFVTLGSYNLWQYRSQDERSMLKVNMIKKSVYFYSPVILR